MEVAKINNSQVNFNGYVDKKFQRTFRKAIKAAEKEFDTKHLHKTREEVFFNYEKRVMADLDKYMQKFDKKTILTTVPSKDKKSYTFVISNKDLGTSLGFELLSHISNPIVRNNINVNAPEFSKQENPRMLVRRMRYFFDNLKSVAPEKIDDKLYEMSKTSGKLAHLKESIKVLDNYILLPVSLFQDIWTRQYNKVAARFGHLEDKISFR